MRIGWLTRLWALLVLEWRRILLLREHGRLAIWREGCLRAAMSVLLRPLLVV
jgi:hypothetical protein